MPTNLCKVGGLYLFPFHHLCIPAKTLWQIQLRFHLSQQFLMPTGLLQGEGSALAAAGAVSLPFGLGRLQISLYAVYRGFAALLCKCPHSQTVMTVQESVSRRWALSSSRAMLRAIFSRQNSAFAFGWTYLGHPRWPCQKQPFMKMTARYLGRTMSGFPGSRLSFNR